MPKYNVIYESKESINGYFPPSREWVHYSIELTVKDGGKKPITLTMTFVPPHPYVFNMPDTHSIKAESISDAYVKVVKFFRRFGMELR